MGKANKETFSAEDAAYYNTTSAAIAKARLSRITFDEWMERVNLMLSLGGYSTGDFETIFWERHYQSGISAGKTAEIILTEMGRAKKNKNV